MLSEKQESEQVKWYNTDAEFNRLYPLPIRVLASNHWTPLSVARKAAQFLAAEKNVRILDIGSGVGKFCLSAAFFMPNATYYGVEQRKSLIDDAEAARQILGLKNVSFIHGNFTQLDFKNYDHFISIILFTKTSAAQQRLMRVLITPANSIIITAVISISNWIKHLLQQGWLHFTAWKMKYHLTFML